MSRPLMTAFVFGLVSAAIAPAASAECDISATKCAVNGGKCNIQFKNRTGDTGGSDGSSGLNQTSSAQTILVKAIDDDQDRVGNKLQIVAGASKTMNIEKKAGKKNGFEGIKISSQDFGGSVGNVTMTCAQVQAVLNGNGTCKVFHGVQSGSATKFSLGFQCDGGNVGGPAKY